MALDLVSRLVAVLVAVAFGLVLTRGRLPVVGTGKMAVLALFAAALGLCTIGGIRDGLGDTVTPTTWLTIIESALGVASVFVLIAVLVGLNWRLGAALLGVTTAASWLAALVFAVSANLPTAPIGLLTLAAVIVAVGVVLWPTFAHRTPAVHAPS